ncbi:hypothetical protein RFW18_03770 [Metabacillus idriensis]|uniref:hypothetical protein n=1 Tax=Metabacillus idriensis TaxID=324768 RepID=UPI0028132724|nr:hypothetical protein [Metabacillus idriensis]MDR0136850.1 hypothetical protein [Metabacillus idriensis]
MELDIDVHSPVLFKNIKKTRKKQFPAYPGQSKSGTALLSADKGPTEKSFDFSVGAVLTEELDGAARQY